MRFSGGAEHTDGQQGRRPTQSRNMKKLNAPTRRARGSGPAARTLMLLLQKEAADLKLVR